MIDSLIGFPVLVIILICMLLFALYALKHARDTIRFQADFIRVLFQHKTELERLLSLSDDERRDDLLIEKIKQIKPNVCSHYLKSLGWNYCCKYATVPAASYQKIINGKMCWLLLPLDMNAKDYARQMVNVIIDINNPVAMNTVKLIEDEVDMLLTFNCNDEDAIKEESILPTVKEKLTKHLTSILNLEGKKDEIHWFNKFKLSPMFALLCGDPYKNRFIIIKLGKEPLQDTNGEILEPADYVEISSSPRPFLGVPIYFGGIEYMIVQASDLKKIKTKVEIKEVETTLV